MRRVLIVSPHFPPDTSAGTHRIRLLAPHLPAYGWEATVVTVDPRDLESRLDPGLAARVPASLRVVRCRALPARWTRLVGVGDLGLRAFSGLRRACRKLLAAERFDALLITIYPTYPALLGPRLKRRFAVPFVLDYQDPWVGAWGESVGGGANGKVDAKSRLSRALAARLEPRAARAADALTAVSAATYEAVLARNPRLRPAVCAAIPLGGEPADFDRLRAEPRPNGFFAPDDGRFHLCYVGTLLPLGMETLAAVFRAVALLRDRRPELAARLELRFFGTSNQTAATAAPRALPLAREMGVADQTSEVAPRLDYLDALRVLTQASAILLLGSSERHYTPSKAYPALLAGRPLLAAYHEASSVVAVLRRAAPSAEVVTYGDAPDREAVAEKIAAALERLMSAPGATPKVDRDAVAESSAAHLAGELAAVL
ncbi:MAG TPA: glycosyltransferase, partial [Thermoanaerobaculia bacterium]